MQVYIAIQEFSAPQVGNRIHLGDTVGKITSRNTCMVDGSEFESLAFFDWIGSANSVLYLASTGVVPDPPFGGLATGFGGAQSIPVGVSNLTVSGINFGFIPVSIVVTVIKPDINGSNIFGTVREDSITQTGFIVDFSAPMGTGYILAYFAAPLVGQLPVPTSFMGGSVSIPSGVATVTVVQAFGFTPTTVMVSVTKPDTEGVNIFATVNSDSITQTGFTVDLSGTTPEAGFVLNYFVKI